MQLWWRTGLRALSAESLALRVAMLVLTDGFHSRLYRSLRTRLGLVYYVRGSVESEDGDASLSRACLATECAAGAVARVVAELRRAVEQLAREGPDPGNSAAPAAACGSASCAQAGALLSRDPRGPLRLLPAQVRGGQGRRARAELLRGITAAQVAAAAAALGEPMVVCGGESPPELPGA